MISADFSTVSSFSLASSSNLRICLMCSRDLRFSGISTSYKKENYKINNLYLNCSKIYFLAQNGYGKHLGLS